MDLEYLELSELTAMLRDEVETSFPAPVWVKAEISSLSHKQNGHCYLELSQSERGVVVAKVRATIWAARWNYINEYFKSVTGSPLGVGMDVLFRSQVNFHPVYGLSLNIDEVDPDFTIGANERRKRETIERLTKEGLIDLQKELSLSLLPYSLAVISAPGAAGLRDFRRHLLENEYGFVFDVDLFEALMQGDQAADSMIVDLEMIEASEKHYDAVLIIRGGGSDLDLACFDDYGLAFAIANCPLPVFTAIGHDRDHSVADMVSFEAVKTPTALADLFIGNVAAEDERISSYSSRLRLAISNKISAMEAAVTLLEQRIKAADPRSILTRGYSLVTDAGGVVVNSAASLRPGQRIHILFADGNATAEVL